MMKTSDQRCCGSGVCIINDAGECWCGQVWNGEKMVAPALKQPQTSEPVKSGDQGISDSN